MKAWHFVAHSRRLQYEDDRIVRTGRTYRTPNNDPISLCENGMHGSVRPIDALPYAPGPIVCRVDITGEIEETDNKFAGRNRKVLWMYDATRVLEKIARECALEVTECWNPPEFVINYLKTGKGDREVIYFYTLEFLENKDNLPHAAIDATYSARAATSFRSKSNYNAYSAFQAIKNAMYAKFDEQYVPSYIAKVNNRLYRALLKGRKK